MNRAQAVAPSLRGQVRFTRGKDRARLAYAVHGSGPPLVLASCWLSHLDHDWQSPVWRHFLASLGGYCTVTRYDERGFGLSDWDVDDFSYQARLADLEVIVDAAGLDRFALMGMSGGAPIALGYAARHPERVSRLVLYGALAAGCFGDTTDEDAESAFLALIRAGWARPDPVFRRVFTTTFIPDATEEQMHWLDDLQRMSTSTSNAVASRIARRAIDVTFVLPEITAPTLVLHARGDRAATYEWGPFLASRIPDARLVTLESRNHILLEDEPAWLSFRDEVRDFLSSEPLTRANTGLDTLSRRELGVLAITAEGLDNDAIADRLGISGRTVERHLQNIYLKLAVSGRSARTAAVAAYLTRPSD